MDNRVEVFCSLQVEGIHCWPTCHLKEVSYLKSPHRHVFWFRAYKLVDHTDRSTEFIVLKHQILKYLKKSYFEEEGYIHQFGHRSCEMIGLELLNKFHLSRIEVSEDGENGAIVYATQLDER